MNKIISTIKELKQLASKERGVELKMSLNGGVFSRKHVWYDKMTNTYDVRNDIDDSIQEGLTEDEFGNQTMILEAINKKSLVVE